MSAAAVEEENGLGGGGGGAGGGGEWGEKKQGKEIHTQENKAGWEENSGEHAYLRESGDAEPRDVFAATNGRSPRR